MSITELIEELKSWYITKIEIDEDYRENKTFATITYQNGSSEYVEVNND